MRPFPIVALVLVTLPVFRAAAQEPQDPPERRAGQLLVRGMTRAFLGDDQGAVALYGEALALTPDDPAALTAMAEARLRLGSLGEAVFFARRAADARPDLPETGLLLARILAETGALAQAIEVVGRFVDLHPRDRELLLARVNLLERMERPVDALVAMRQAADLAPADPTVLLRLLDMEMRAGHLERSLALLDTLDALVPADPGLALRRGRVLVQLDRPTEAEREFARALVLAPGLPEARDALAALRTDATPSPDLAGAAWLERAEANPRDREAWTMAVRTLSREGRSVQALRAADDALVLFPGDARLHVEAGMASIAAAVPDPARSHFTSALRDLEERPSDAPGLDSLARAGLHAAASLAGDPASTMDHSPSGADGQALAALGLLGRDPRRALQLARAALERDPSGPLQIAAALAALTAADRTEEALSLAGTHADSASPLVLLYAGDLYAAAGNRDRAVALWRRASEASPGSPMVSSRLDRP